MRVVVIACGALFALATPAYTAIITVFNTNDSLAGSLRQALQDASPNDTIVFHIPTSSPGYNPNTGIYTIGLTSSSLVISKNLSIDGGGQKISVQRTGASAFRIFNISAGVTVTMTGLTIANGFVLSDGGAGIYNFGSLILLRCTFRGNSTSFAPGGAVRNDGSLSVHNCTFSGNTTGNAPMGLPIGGAIFNAGSLTLTNSTLSGNTAYQGAGIYNNATARIRNTIVVGNNPAGGPAFDAHGAFISQGYNLIGDGSNATGFGATGDQVGASPAQANLSPLRDNGGPTHTMRPLTGSLAIDQGNRGLDDSNQPINFDQRGYTRPVDLPGTPNAIMGDGSDIGAVETGPAQTGSMFTVTNSDGHHDNNCSIDDCTWLDAIYAANANADTNTISFAPEVGGVITPEFEAIIGQPVSIVGPGARRLSVSGANSRRIFTITSQASGVAISGLTLTNGLGNSDGGAIYAIGPNLTITDCTISSSRAQVSQASGGNGGALYNFSSATLLRCTMVGNTATGFGGGAVFNNGTFTATNCTFFNNSAPAGGGILSVSNNGNSLTTLRNCTITNNTATSTGSSTAGGGGYYGEGAVGNSLHHFSNTILAGNINANNPDLRGFGTTEGNNLIGNLGQGGSGFTNGVNGDKVGVSAGLNSLGNNGGPTDTCSLLGTSVAINMGNNALAPQKDQRSYSRNGVSDIGAFEFSGTAPPPVPLTSVVSSKVHGAQTFGINLPLTGSPGVECRSAGATGDFTIVLNSINPLTLVGGRSVTSGAATIVPGAGINASDSHQYIIQLTGVANAQVVTLELLNVTDSLGNNTAVLQVPVGFLVGDTSGNGSVTGSDVSLTKLQSGQVVSGSNFRTDVTVSGTINGTDVSSVKARTGTALP